jgi:hypothetical protein
MVVGTEVEVDLAKKQTIRKTVFSHILGTIKAQSGFQADETKKPTVKSASKLLI